MAGKVRDRIHESAQLYQPFYLIKIAEGGFGTGQDTYTAAACGRAYRSSSIVPAAGTAQQIRALPSSGAAAGGVR